MSSLNSSTSAYVIQNDQQAINAAYQVADFALVERNIRDQQRILPIDVIQEFSRKGLGAIRIAEKYGGAEVSNKTLAHVFRILSKADASVGQIPQNQFGLLNAIENIANEQQKQFIYTEILNGKRLSNGGPERNTKDTRTIETRLEHTNGQYLLNGEKFYSTGSYFADWLAIRAIHPDGHIVLTVIDAKADGVEIVDDWDGFGQRTTASGTVRLKMLWFTQILLWMKNHLPMLQNIVVLTHNFFRSQLMSVLQKLLFQTPYPQSAKPVPSLMPMWIKPVLKRIPYKKSVSSISYSMHPFYCWMKPQNI